MSASIRVLVRLTLIAELAVGGQARLTDALTPRLHDRAMAKADGTKKYLAFIPIRDPTQHTQFIGLLMCTAAVLLYLPGWTLAGGLLSISLTLAGVYTQYRMGIPYWLPAVNTVFSSVAIWQAIARRV